MESSGCMNEQSTPNECDRGSKRRKKANGLKKKQKETFEADNENTE